jgi:hypothetical protein
MGHKFETARKDGHILTWSVGVLLWVYYFLQACRENVQYCYLIGFFFFS